MSAPARREQLLDIATGVAIQQGFHAVSFEAVAQRAGITRALIYQHFKDIKALLEAVVEREMSRALAQVSETALRDLSRDNARELMLDSLRTYLQAVREHPTTWRLVLIPPEGAPRSLRKRIARGRATVLEQLAQAVRPALAAEQDSDAELTASVLSAISDEYARLLLTDPVRFDPERLLRHARWCLYQPRSGRRP